MSSTAPALSPRSYERQTEASSWEEIWEAGPYYERISELLDSAERFVVFVGWQIDSRLPLRRAPDSNGNPGPMESFKKKILRLCAEKPTLHIYFLIWDHASFYIIEREWWQARHWEDIHPRVHFVFDNRHPFGGSHHEKICIIDGKVAFCGGIDLCDERWDTPQHLYEDPRRSLDWRHEHHGPYHDMAVQLTGPVCRDILEHVRERWSALSAVPFPAPPKGVDTSQNLRGHRVYLSRTLVSELPGGGSIIREIEFLFRDLVQKAQHEILVEGQYYWSRELNDALIAKIRRMRGTEFRVTLILSELKRSKSFTRNMARHELQLLAQLQSSAEECGVHLTMGAPYVMSEEAGKPLRPIYVHSKLLIIDDRFIAMGSANFATRALRVDTELGVTLEALTPAEHAHIRRVKQSIRHHWGMDCPSGIRGGVFLRPFKPVVEIAHMQQFRWRAPWQPFFDPSVPWLRPLKSRLRPLLGANRIFRRTSASWLCTWAGSSISLAIVSPRFSSLLSMVIVGLLSSVVVAPVPFFILTAALVPLFGEAAAFKMSLVTLWFAAVVRYALERAFPSAPNSSMETNSAFPSRLNRRLGHRSLRSMLLAATDPRDGAHRKITALGRYCIPFYWFMICMLVIFPMLVAITVLLARSVMAWAQFS